jgi:CcmD family protein
MFFLETPPDTSGYMIAGYAIAFVVMLIYVASLILRYRNLNRDLSMLEEMDKDN